MKYKLQADFFKRDTLTVAHELLGKTLLYQGCGGTIIETEAYHQSEASCHAYQGKKTARNQAMFLAGGHVYIYRIHQVFCLNISTETEGIGSAVLIRALSPTHGKNKIAQRRHPQPEKHWVNGPGKICLALKLDLAQNGLSIVNNRSALGVYDTGLVYKEAQIQRTARIGISQAQDLPWRFIVQSDVR